MFIITASNFVREQLNTLKYLQYQFKMVRRKIGQAKTRFKKERRTNIITTKFTHFLMHKILRYILWKIDEAKTILFGYLFSVTKLLMLKKLHSVIRYLEKFYSFFENSRYFSRQIVIFV